MDRGRLPDGGTRILDPAPRDLIALARGAHVLAQQDKGAARLVDFGEIDLRHPHIEQRRGVAVKLDFLAVEPEQRGGAPAAGVLCRELPRERWGYVLTRQEETHTVAHLPGADRLPADGIHTRVQLRAKPRSADLVRMRRKFSHSPPPTKSNFAER